MAAAQIVARRCGITETLFSKEFALVGVTAAVASYALYAFSCVIATAAALGIAITLVGYVIVNMTLNLRCTKGGACKG